MYFWNWNRGGWLLCFQFVGHAAFETLSLETFGNLAESNQGQKNWMLYLNDRVCFRGLMVAAPCVCKIGMKCRLNGQPCGGQALSHKSRLTLFWTAGTALGLTNYPQPSHVCAGKKITIKIFNCDQKWFGRTLSGQILVAYSMDATCRAPNTSAVQKSGSLWVRV